jgi:hypothetical protein
MTGTCPPAIVQNWNGAARLAFGTRPDRLYPAAPRAGVVVGTFAAVPYVHLQLEARRRFYPDVPLLVHDDASHKAAEIERLCREYGCDFEYNERRQPPCVGDLTAFVGGLAWAKARGLDVLLKVSRRWVFLADWAPDLAALAAASQYATLGSYTTTFGFGFRTECLALSVAAWSSPATADDLCGLIRRGTSVFVEAYMHDLARRLERQNCAAADGWLAANPAPDDRNGYALWPLMGTDRCERSASFLWHDSCGPQEYYAVSREWGLPYGPDDFADPNQAGGNGA